MNFINKYPYTNFHELNLDWVIKIVEECVNKIKSIDETIQISVEGVLSEWLENGTIIDLLRGEVLTPVTNQIESVSGRESVADKRVAMLDENGQIFGSSINIIDLMIKPRLPATNSIPVFDRNGNLVPLCFDRNYPYITSDMLLLSNMTDDVLMPENFSDTESGQCGITFKNGLKVMYGYVQFSTSNMAAVGNVYHENIIVNIPFYRSFNRKPRLILGTPDDMNNPIWITGESHTVSGITRISVYAPQAYNNLNSKVPYIAIGY